MSQTKLINKNEAVYWINWTSVSTCFYSKHWLVLKIRGQVCTQIYAQSHPQRCSSSGVPDIMWPSRFLLRYEPLPCLWPFSFLTSSCSTKIIYQTLKPRGKHHPLHQIQLGVWTQKLLAAQPAQVHSSSALPAFSNTWQLTQDFPA